MKFKFCSPVFESGKLLKFLDIGIEIPEHFLTLNNLSKRIPDFPY